jgi:hypothetical protein
MTISIVGNSHVVALKEAAVDFPCFFSYFYAPGGNLREVIVQDGKLIGGTERLRALLEKRNTIPGRNVQKEVELKEDAAFIVVGMGLSPLLVAKSYASTRLFSHMSRRMTMVSAECLEEILVEQIRFCGAFNIARLIRENSDRPIFVVPQPSLIETAKTFVFQDRLQQRSMELWQPLLDNSVGEILLPIYERALARAADRENLIAVAQPASTMTGILTRAEYQRKPDDFRHGNPSYGAHVLRRLKREIETVGILDALVARRD